MSGGDDGARLRDGERVLLIDAKQRRYLITLRAGTSFHTHVGIVDHDHLIGAEDGSTVLGSTGRRFVVLRPTLADVILKMPRGAQVIYPKDLAAIVMQADIAPGVRVLEAGVGSGALSMAMLRAGADVLGYELREDFAARARANVEDLLGPDAPYQVEVRDVYEGIDERGLDRVVLDLPEPWRVVPHAEVALRSGGILCSYLPDHQPVVAAPPRPRPQPVPDGGDPGGPPPHLAHRGPVGPARPPDGGPHRLPDHRPPAGPTEDEAPYNAAKYSGTGGEAEVGDAGTEGLGPAWT